MRHLTIEACDAEACAGAGLDTNRAAQGMLRRFGRIGHIFSVLFALAALLGLAPAYAEVGQADPPGRVGRLSHVEGTVSYHRANEDQWSAAKRNLPVTSGDSFWTEPGSRAEIQIGPMALRMDELSELDIARLDDRVTEFELKQGTISVILRAAPKDGVRVLTPRGEIVLVRKGSYRIDAGEPREGGPPVEVTVLDGFARVHAPRGTLELSRGESAVIDGNPATYAVGEAEPAPIDEWAQSRERRAVARDSRRYVPEEMTGHEDLDSHGRWRDDPDYGPVWYPAAVPPGWAPYRHGHWAYVAPWGWTWIDDAPWGFAPFHYGRWAFIGGAWGWCPGTFVAAPVYAPALVAFVGGSNWGVSLSIGGAIGWLPLAPYEVYRPYYPASVTYVRNVNITNVHRTVINNIRDDDDGDRDIRRYKHRDHATVVGERDFSRGRHVREAALRVPRERLAHAPTSRRLDHVRPDSDSRDGARGPAIRGAGERKGRDASADRQGRRGQLDNAINRDGAGAGNARIAPSAGRPDEPSRQDRQRDRGSRGPSRDTQPGPIDRGPAAGSERPNAPRDDGSRPGETRASRAPGSPVTSREDGLSRDAAPGGAREGRARAPNARQSNAGPDVDGPGTVPPDRTPGQRGTPQWRPAREEPGTRSASPGPSPTMRAPRDSTGRQSSGPESRGPESRGRESSGRNSRETTAPQRMPKRSQPPVQPQTRQPESRQAPPLMRPEPRSSRPAERQAPQASPREAMPAPESMPRLASPPPIRSAPNAPVMRAPQATNAPPQAAPPSSQRGPQGGGSQGPRSEHRPERRRQGNAP